MCTILVTGASGFLGKHLVEELSKCKEYNVVAVVSGRRIVKFPQCVKTVACNLLKEQERETLITDIKPEIICHLAWGQDNADFRNSVCNLEWLEASISILRNFVKSGGQVFYFAGTSSEYDYNDGKAHENVKLSQMSMYGECKKSFSSIMSNYCERNGVRYIDARYFTIYGEGDPHKFGAIPETIKKLINNENVICKAPNTIRDYIYVKDAVYATSSIINSSFCGSINIGSGIPHTMKEVFTLIAKELGKEHLLGFENQDICDLILVADVSKLNNYKHKFIDFELGIKNTIDWWKREYGRTNQVF